jgi:GNAT superfamily N-acetyltransferase
MSEKVLGSEVTISEFRPSYVQFFRDINIEWLEQYFVVEPFDHALLHDPELHIIKQGGFIFFAHLDSKIVGCCALLKHNDTKYEMAKMAVLANFRNRGIGRLLVGRALERSREVGATTVVLATSNKLLAANYLYQSMGFQYANPKVIGPLPYQRETIVMALEL